jgi:hypothetical protein
MGYCCGYQHQCWTWSTKPIKKTICALATAFACENIHFISVPRQVHSLFQTECFWRETVQESYNVVVFTFAFHIAVQQPLEPLWPRLLLCDHEPSQPPTVLCFMSLLMSLLPASGEFVSEFPSPRVILSFFPHPWPYRLWWLCQELKLPPASLSGSWGVLGPPTMSRWQP